MAVTFSVHNILSTCMFHVPADADGAIAGGAMIMGLVAM